MTHGRHRLDIQPEARPGQAAAYLLVGAGSLALTAWLGKEISQDFQDPDYAELFAGSVKSLLVIGSGIVAIGSLQSAVHNLHAGDRNIGLDILPWMAER